MNSPRDEAKLRRLGFTEQELAKKRPRKPRARKTAKGCPTEYEEQKALIKAARGPWGVALGIDRRLVHVPNSGHGSNLGQAAMLNATGLRKGYPDLILDKARAPFHGLRIEMKTLKGGVVSPEQRAWHKVLEEEGYCVQVCHGHEVAMACIEEYMRSPLNLVRGDQIAPGRLILPGDYLEQLRLPL